MRHFLTVAFAGLALMATSAMATQYSEKPICILSGFDVDSAAPPGAPDIALDSAVVLSDLAVSPAAMPPFDVGDGGTASIEVDMIELLTDATPTPLGVGGTQGLAWPSAVM